MEIEDDFLEQKEFDKLQTSFMGDMFPWFFSDEIDYKDDKNKYQFVHRIYSSMHPFQYSEACATISPILKIINPLALIRAKANLLTRTSNIIENSYHFDMEFKNPEKMKLFGTSIYYVNTNNGYTKFEDGTKVESVANRMITFPADMKHTGTSCTDEKRRIIINFKLLAAACKTNTSFNINI